jgi:large subunit ribosomal protein L25
MKSIDIKVTARKNLGRKQSQALRFDKHVPCVLYGGKENIHFSAHENTFKNIIYTNIVYLINIDVDGQHHQAVLKEIQFHPVTDRILHIDFVEISPNKPAVVSIPVNITGTAVGVTEGGKMRQRKRYVRVKGLISDIPDFIEIDISNLSIGQSVLSGDLSYDKFEILEPKRAAVVSVISSRAAARSMGEEPVVEAAPVAAPTETPEVAAAPVPEQPKK